MSAQNYIIEIDTISDDCNTASLYLVHPINDDIYYKFYYSDGDVDVSDTWSVDTNYPKGYEKVIKDFMQLKIEEYEEAQKERYDGVGPYEYFGVNQSDFY